MYWGLCEGYELRGAQKSTDGVRGVRGADPQVPLQEAGPPSQASAPCLPPIPPECERSHTVDISGGVGPYWGTVLCAVGHSAASPASAPRRSTHLPTRVPPDGTAAQAGRQLPAEAPH